MWSNNLKIALILLTVLVSACATNNIKPAPNKEVVFKPNYTLTLNPRSFAVISYKSKSELKTDGYVELGELKVIRAEKKCFPDPELENVCEKHKHMETLTNDLLNRTAEKGGDVMQIDIDEKQTSRTVRKKGECASFVTVSRPVEQCHYDKGERKCHTRIAVERVCDKYKSVAGKEFYSESSGIVWRKDAELYTRVNLADGFHVAIENGDIRRVKNFISLGAKTSQPDIRDRYAIISAAKTNYVEVADILFDHGANIYQFSDDGIPLLGLAARYGHIDMLKLIVEKMTTQPNENLLAVYKIALLEAVEARNIDIVKLFLNTNLHKDINPSVLKKLVLKNLILNQQGQIVALQGETELQQFKHSFRRKKLATQYEKTDSKEKDRAFIDIFIPAVIEILGAVAQ